VSVRRSEVADIGGRLSDPEKRVSVLCVKIANPAGGDGDLALSNLGRRESGTRGAGGEGTPRVGPTRNTHVTALGIDADSRLGAGISPKEGIPG